MNLETGESFCSKCARFYIADDFQINKQGKRNKTCKRHTKKRVTSFDAWDDFIALLRNWNKLVREYTRANLAGTINR